MENWFLPAALLISITALFAWMNAVYIRLPQTIGLMIMGLAASLLLVGFEAIFPSVVLLHQLSHALTTLDFTQTLMTGMLGFLLFAGALHVDVGALKSRGWVVGTMATFGTFLSILIVGGLFWWAAKALGFALPLSWALVFGALISPTDPVAVMAALKNAKISSQLKTDMNGESLFNDGVGVVFFTILLAVAVAGGHGQISPLHVLHLLFVEAVGGAALGLITGYVAYRAMRKLDDYVVEILISLALVMSTYGIADVIGLSGPIAVVMAGIFIGNTGARNAMSETTREHLFAFWTLIDEMLNCVLFLFIGLEVMILGTHLSLMPLALIAIPVVAMARLASVAAGVGILRWFTPFVRGTIAMLSWGGLRGGISIAMALSLPQGEYRPMLLAATYAVAFFTIVVQGLSFPRLIRHYSYDKKGVAN